MTKVPQALLLAGISVFGTAISSRSLAQPAPNTPHPRLWLNAQTLSGLKAQANTANSAVKRAQTRCVAARTTPDEYSTGGWQGFEFVLTLSACLTAYEAIGNADDLATAIKYFRVLLDDYQSVGDGAGGDNVVTHDTGYAMRTFAPYSAIAYDWLHDAPGVTEELRAHARARFDAWSTYYVTSGYLKDLPGANYHAGYAFAATLIATAEAGEAGAAGEAHWANVRDVIWKKDLAPAMQAGVLEGGDWPEGWQYGSLSVLEHALAARALADAGVAQPAAAPWASSLPLRFLHGLTPAAHQSFVGGDSDAATAYRDPDNGPLLAALLGPASPEAQSLARKLNTELQLIHENPLFDALAAAVTAGAENAPTPALTTSYLARGTGNWYVRSDWSKDASWSVFQCSRHLVDDHQYSNAGNWVFTRGADDLVVDPSPYGSLSTLTGNAPAIDTGTLPSGYSPSQGFWGKTTGLNWSRQSESGIAAARCDYADQFGREDVASDVRQALRDFVLLPAGKSAAVVLVDRVVTAGPERALHLRVRSPGSFTLAGDTASASRGGSALTVQKLWSSSGTPTVRTMTQADECPSSDHACDVSKLAEGGEYRLDVSGPAAGAIHIVGATPSGSQPSAKLLEGSGYRGASIELEGTHFVVMSGDASTAAKLSYRAPAAAGSVHVVLDAPRGSDGSSDVSATLEGQDCVVQVSPHSGAAGGIPSKPLIARLGADCSVADDGVRPDDAQQAPSLQPVANGAAGGPSGPSSSSGGAGGGTGSSVAASAPGAPSAAATAVPGDAGGCALSATQSGPGAPSALLLGAVSAFLGSRLRRRHRSGSHRVERAV